MHHQTQETTTLKTADKQHTDGGENKIQKRKSSLSLSVCAAALLLCLFSTQQTHNSRKRQQTEETVETDTERKSVSSIYMVYVDRRKVTISFSFIHC